MKRTVWILGVLLLAVALTGCATTDQNTAGEALAKTTTVRATSCDADDLCETNTLNSNLIVSNSISAIGVLSGNEAQVSKLLIMGDDAYSREDDLIFTVRPGTSEIREWYFARTNDEGRILLSFQERKPTDVVRVTGELEVGGLVGTGNAYACLTNEGKLFRSATPCA